MHNNSDCALNNLQGVMVFNPQLSGEAKEIAQSCGLDLIENEALFQQKSKLRLKFFKHALELNPAKPFVFLVEDEGLQLVDLSNGVAILVDFCHGKANHRRVYGGGLGQMIAKAVGIKGSLRPRVLDATAGLGQDSFVLASLGCQVKMLERSTVVQYLLQDGLRRAQHESLGDPELADVVNRMSLHKGDAITLLRSFVSEANEQVGEQADVEADVEVEDGTTVQDGSDNCPASWGNDRPHVVYLDPMFPERKKSAQVKKEMQSFHQVVGSDMDANDLLAPALDLALSRVVVKRPKIAPYLAEREPDHQIIGKSSRYDIYINRALEKC